MRRLGSDAEHAREMVIDDILRGRINLMIHICKDYLQGDEPGERQRLVMEKNAIHVEMECSLLTEFTGKAMTPYRSCIDEKLCFHIKLLAILSKSVARRHPTGAYRKKAMLENMKIVRKSLVLKKDQLCGTVLTEQLLTAKRPATGIGANHLHAVIGKRLRKNVPCDVPLQLSYLE